MKITELFKIKTVLSFEVFPPKKTSPLDTIYKTLNELVNLSPDFISVTYSAGGSDNSESTIAISSTIKNQYHIESVAHLTCISQTKEEVLSLLERLKANNIENILALRGDINPDIPPKQDFRYASDLISFIRKNSDFNIIAACYPEGHNEAVSLAADILNLKIKVESGVDHLISQLFFDNNYFYTFLERVEHAGITVPIEAGIMPVVNKKQIERMVSLCGVNLPKKFTAMMNRYENNPIAMRDAGIAYAVDQIVDLVSQGVDGIHLYTMNNAYIAQKINEAVKSLLISPR
jgi:methylenetetrahydrofolate reductase (NADPH)